MTIDLDTPVVEQPVPPVFPNTNPLTEPLPVASLPKKGTHRLRTTLLVSAGVLAIGAISFLGVSLSSATNDKANLQATVKNQAHKLHNQSVSLGTLIKAAASEQRTIDKLQSQLDVQDEVPPGGYSTFQSNLISDITNNEGVTPATVDCVLPSTWTPGGQFNCNVFDSSGIALGSALITVESNNPDGSPQWEFAWTAASDGYGGY